MVVRKDISQIIAKASKLDESKMGYLTPEEWETKRVYDGANKFKRASMGQWKNKTVKTLEEIGTILYMTNIAPNLDKGIELAPTLVGGEVKYQSLRMPSLFPRYKLVIKEVQDHKEEKKYKIELLSSVK